MQSARPELVHTTARSRPRERPRPWPLARTLTLALALLPAAVSQAAGRLVPYDGAPLPPFTLGDTSGETHALADYRGKVVLVNFWATWCAPCVREMPSMARLDARLADEPFALLAVNAGEETAVLAPFLERLGLDLTVLLDPDGTAVRDWGVFAYPTTVLVDPLGEARWIVRGELDWESPEAIETIRSMMPSASEATRPVARARDARPSVAIDTSAGHDGLAGWALERLPPLGARRARAPDLTRTNDGTVVASWLEASGATGAALRVARLGPSGWQTPATVASGDDWFVSWADFPILSPMAETGLAVTWLVRNGLGPYAYDLNLARSTDGGRTWSAPLVPHRDGTPTQHGFASMAPLEDGRLLVTWLDGRVNARAGDRSRGLGLPTDGMTLRTAILGTDGALEEERLLDERVCTCCATASVALEGGDALVAYRDRTLEEIRDVTVRRLGDGVWERATSVHDDGWHIAGCPVNGPSLAADGARVALAWFTAANDTPRVRLAFSSDAGGTFDVPQPVDDGRPLGRTDVVLLEDGSALVSWLEAGPLGEELRLRRVTPKGERSASRTIAHATQGPTMGFPRMVRAGKEVVIAWSVAEGGGAIGGAILSTGNEETGR